MNPESKDASQQRKWRHWCRVFLITVTAFYTVVYAGAMFGWGPMQLMLEENGAFEERCDDGEETPCPAQTSRLLNIQLVAQLTFIFSPLVGGFADSFGAKHVMLCTAVFACAGLSFLTLATSQHLDNLLYLAYILVGFTTISCHIMIIQTGLIFEGVTQQRVMSAMNSLFDAGALTYLALRTIKNATGATLEAIAASYLAIAVVVFGSAVYLWYIVVPSRDESATLAPSQLENERDPELSRMTTEPFDQSNTERPLESPTACDTVDSVSVIPLEGGEEISTGESSAKTANDYVLISARSQVQQLRSKQYVILVIFFAFHASGNVFTLTTARDFLAYLGDDETGNKYLTIFTLLTPASILALPLMDWVLNHRGYHAGLQSINALALIHGIIKVSSEKLKVQVLGFVVFSIFRCFMFTVTFSFLPTFLSLKVVGKAAGMLTLSQGVCSMINIPLASLAVNQFDGNFFYPNLFYTVGILPCFYLAWIMGQGIQKEEQAKKLPEAKDSVAEQGFMESE